MQEVMIRMLRRYLGLEVKERNHLPLSISSQLHAELVEIRMQLARLPLKRGLSAPVGWISSHSRTYPPLHSSPWGLWGVGSTAMMLHAGSVAWNADYLMWRNIMQQCAADVVNATRTLIRHRPLPAHLSPPHRQRVWPSIEGTPSWADFLGSLSKRGLTTGAEVWSNATKGSSSIADFAFKYWLAVEQLSLVSAASDASDVCRSSTRCKVISRAEFLRMPPQEYHFAYLHTIEDVEHIWERLHHQGIVASPPHLDLRSFVAAHGDKAKSIRTNDGRWIVLKDTFSDGL